MNRFTRLMVWCGRIDKARVESAHAGTNDTMHKLSMLACSESRYEIDIRDL